VGVRQYIRRAHEEPRWGRFMNCFGFSNATMQALWATDPMANLQAGIESRRYLITTATDHGSGHDRWRHAGGHAPGARGHGTWRDVGSDTAELLLIALGLTREEACAGTGPIAVFTLGVGRRGLLRPRAAADHLPHRDALDDDAVARAARQGAMRQQMTPGQAGVHAPLAARRNSIF
jgi:hypothetical protein